MIELTVRTIHTGAQYVPAICGRVEGSDKMACLFGSYAEGIDLTFITVREHDQASVPQYRGNDYPLDRIQASLRHIAEDRGLGLVPYDMATRFLPGLASVPTEASAEAPPTRKADSETNDPVRREAVLRSSPSVIGIVCDELKLDPVVVRRALRASGMAAPYTDLEKIRKILREAK